MLVHPIQAGLHRKQHGLRQLGVLAVFGHAVDPAALFRDHLLGPCNMSDRLDKVVVLGCHHSSFLARARREPARLKPRAPHDLVQQRQDRVRRERLGDIGAITVPGRHLFRVKPETKIKGMLRFTKTSATAKASWPLTRTSSSAASNRSRSIVSSARSKVATGPTTAQPPAGRLVPPPPAITPSSPTTSPRRPARPTRGFPRPGSACPTLRRVSGFGLVGGPRSKAGMQCRP